MTNTTQTNKTPTKKDPKQYLLFPLIGLCIAGYFVYSLLSPSEDKPVQPVQDLTARKAQVVALFQSDKEPTVKHAFWVTDNIFKVAVFDDGTKRNSYASYICQTLYAHGFKRQNKVVQVIDVVKLANQKQWVELGIAYCK